MASARPRPRPRPRPVPAAATVSSPTHTPSTSSVTATSSSTLQPQEVEDEDALFIRNRSRTTSEWKKLEELDKKAVRRPVSSDDESEPSPRSRKHKRKNEKDILPSWTKNKDIIRLLSEDLDDDFEQLAEKSPDTPKAKRPRSQSRSRSITPPPALSTHQIEHARNIVRQTLAGAHRPPSPTLVLDDEPDPILLEPELVKIAQAIRSDSSKSLVPESSDLNGGPEVVAIKMRWRPHPLNVTARSQVWEFQMNRHDTFRQIFEETADMATILSDNLIVSYRNARLFPSATPNTLKIWAEAELEACDKTTHDYIRSRRSKSPSVATDDGGLSYAGSDDSDEELNLGSEPESIGGEKFKLTLRSAITTKDIVLTVRPTTTCGAIVNAFLKSAGLLNKYPPSSRKRGKAEPVLQIDGDKMSPSAAIGDAGLDDGDCVDVVGL